MSKEKLDTLNKYCFWNSENENSNLDEMPCLKDNSSCQYSFMRTEKAQMYRKGCEYFKE
jgi:hypothetical protein